MNEITYHTILGSILSARFEKLIRVRPIYVNATNNSAQIAAYNVSIENITYANGSHENESTFSLYHPADYIMYKGEKYRIDDMNKLVMICENENNRKLIEEL